MAATTQEGTGKHPHKSAAEPREHHEAPTTKGADHKASSKASSATHTGGGSHKQASAHTGEGSPSTGQSAGDLESRAYTGPDGKEHHHTTKYAEQHKSRQASEKGGHSGPPFFSRRRENLKVEMRTDRGDPGRSAVAVVARVGDVA